MKIRIGESIFSNFLKTNDFEYPESVELLDLGSVPDGWLTKDCIALSQGASVEESISEMVETGVWQVVQSKQQNLLGQLSVAATIIDRPDSFFDHPAEEILKSGKGAIQQKRWLFRSSSEKIMILKSIDAYLQEIKGANALRDAINQVADEFYTNALFNGPFGQEKFSLDRSTVVVLNSDKMAELIIGHDSERIFVACVDMFGTLDCQGLLERLNNSYRDGVSRSINMGKGGAGIGFLRVLSLSNDLYVISEEEKKTLVACTFLLGKSPKFSRTNPKNIHFQRYKKFELGASSFKIQKRRTCAFFKISGDLKGTLPLAGVDLTEIEEVFFDFRKTKNIDEESLAVILKWVAQVDSVRSVSFNYVPFQILKSLKKFEAPKSQEREISSVLLPFECRSCNTKEMKLFVKREKGLSLKGEPNISSPPICKSCDVTMEPSAVCSDLIIT